LVRNYPVKTIAFTPLERFYPVRNVSSKAVRNKFLTGFTLLELMVALGIFVTIVTLTFSITGRGRMSWTESSARMYIHSQARIVSTEVTRELMLSKYSRIFLSDNDRDGTDESIKFSVPVVDGSTGNLKGAGRSGLQWGDGSIQGNSINYVFAEGNLLRRILDSDSNVVEERIIARNVSYFSVARKKLWYEITVGFHLDDYLGRPLSEPIDYSILIAATPKN